MQGAPSPAGTPDGGEGGSADRWLVKPTAFLQLAEEQSEEPVNDSAGAPLAATASRVTARRTGQGPHLVLPVPRGPHPLGHLPALLFNYSIALSFICIGISNN